MAGMIPYSNYERALRRQFPFDMFDELLGSPLSVNANDAFKMDVEDAGDAYVVNAYLAGMIYTCSCLCAGDGLIEAFSAEMFLNG